MTFVPHASMNGQRWRCAVTGRSTDDEGFFDSHRILEGWDQPVHLSAAAVKEMARQIGWISPQEIEDISTRLREYGAEVEALKSRLEKVEQIKALEAELEEVVA